MESATPVQESGRQGGRTMKLNELISLTAINSGYSTDDIKGRCRVNSLVEVRQGLIYRMRIETDHSLSEIGLALGGRSAATIAWGFQREAEKIESIRQLIK